MISKVQSVIILATFLAVPAAVPSAIISMIVYDAFGSEKYALAAMVISFLPMLILLGRTAVWFIAMMQSELRDDVGEWVTVEKNGKKLPVKLNVTKVYQGENEDKEAMRELLKMEYTRRLQEIGE
jgi:hypothetical protein